MTDNVRIVRVPIGGSQPHPLLQAFEAFSVRHSNIIYGSDDYKQPLSLLHGRDLNPALESWRGVIVLSDDDARSRAVNDLDERLRDDPAVLAELIEDPDGTEDLDDVLAVLWLKGARNEALDAVESEVLVDPRWRVGALPSLAQSVVEAQALAMGRPFLSQWSENPSIVPTEDPGAIQGVAVPFPGKGDQRSATHVNSSRLLQERGYQPAHTEWVCILDVDIAGIDPTADAPDQGPDGRAILTWTAPASPEHLHQPMSDLLTLASADIPAGALRHEAETWTPERLQVSEENYMRSMVKWVVAAEQLEDGTLAGLTTMIWSMDHPEIVHQEGTIVSPDHRQEGVATRIKRANEAALLRANPEARRIYTWENGNNGAMVATNEKLGFRPVALGIGWQKDLSA